MISNLITTDPPLTSYKRKPNKACILNDSVPKLGFHYFYRSYRDNKQSIQTKKLAENAQQANSLNPSWLRTSFPKQFSFIKAKDWFLPILNSIHTFGKT